MKWWNRQGRWYGEGTDLGHRRTGEVLAVIVAHGIATWLVFVVFSTLLGKIGTFGTQVPSDHKRALSASSWNGMFWGTQGMHKIVGVTWTEPRRLEPCWCTTLPEKEHSKVVPNGWRRGGKFLNQKFVLMANWSPRNRCFPSFNPVFLPVLASSVAWNRVEKSSTAPLFPKCHQHTCGLWCVVVLCTDWSGIEAKCRTWHCYHASRQQGPGLAVWCTWTVPVGFGCCGYYGFWCLLFQVDLVEKDPSMRQARRHRRTLIHTWIYIYVWYMYDICMIYVWNMYNMCIICV